MDLGDGGLRALHIGVGNGFFLRPCPCQRLQILLTGGFGLRGCSSASGHGFVTALGGNHAFGEQVLRPPRSLVRQTSRRLGGAPDGLDRLHILAASAFAAHRLNGLTRLKQGPGLSLLCCNLRAAHQSQLLTCLHLIAL